MTPFKYQAQLTLDGAFASTPDDAAIVLDATLTDPTDLDLDLIPLDEVHEIDPDSGLWLVTVSPQRHRSIQADGGLFDTVPFVCDNADHEHLASIVIELP